MGKIKILLFIITSLIFIPRANASELSLHGFLQTNYSVRVSDDNPQGAKRGNLMLGEERAQIKASFYPQKSKIGIFVKSDFYHDWVSASGGEDWAFDFREGYLDLAEDNFGLRAGRQIYTWGAGDLLFINDVFPKDWEAFYSGRPLEYLKIGVDSLKLDVYSNIVSAEAVIMPFFEADDLPSVGRFHFFDPYPDIPNRELEKPDSAFEKFGNMEYALRLYRNIRDFDVSAYVYKGFFRSPGMKANNFNSPTTISSFYPGLAVYGFSAQRNALGGVISAEYGYYDSLDDRSGNDPSINNSQSRFLIGYQKAFPEDFTVGIQYYGELMHRYRQYEDNLPSSFAKKEQLHQYITLRLTKLLKYQTLKLSVFTFYSPDEEDFLITPEVSYNFSDNLLGVIGMNIFAGVEDDTTFGQHKKDTNIYVTVRCNF